MTEDPNIHSNEPGAGSTGSQAGPETSSSADSWSDVGKQFKNLGESIGEAVKAAWNDPQSQKQLRMIQDGLEEMVSEVRRAVNDVAESPQGQQVRDETRRAAESVRKAGEETYQEVRPHLANALRTVTTELEGLVQRMEKGSQAGSQPPSSSAPGPDTESASSGPDAPG